MKLAAVAWADSFLYSGAPKPGGALTAMICPQCRSGNCYRSHRDGPLDFFGTLIGLRPWRCRTCENRFFGRRVALAFATYAHCRRCGNFDLEQIARERVEEGTLLFLKRLAGFPAYRCDPCRKRFFSVLPYRRIVPSTRPAAI